MFDTLKNKTRDINRRIRQKENKGFGPSPRQRRRFKKYRLKKNRRSIQQLAAYSTPPPAKGRKPPNAPLKRLAPKLDNAAVRIQMAWRRAVLSRRCFERRVENDVFDENDDDVFDISIMLASCKARFNSLLDKIQELSRFVNHSMSVLVNCSPLRSQVSFYMNQAVCIGNIFGDILLSEDSMTTGLLNKCAEIQEKRFQIIAGIVHITVRMNELAAIPNAI